LYRSLGFLKLDEVYKLQINKFMYQLQCKTENTTLVVSYVAIL